MTSLPKHASAPQCTRLEHDSISNDYILDIGAGCTKYVLSRGNLIDDDTDFALVLAGNVSLTI